MTQEDIELLATDISARVKYGVKVQLTENKETIERYALYLQGYPLKPKLVFAFITYESTTFGSKYRLNLQGDIVRLEDCKPYLRPMSSMTEEEKEQLAIIRSEDFQLVRQWIKNESIKETGVPCPVTCGEIDFCNKKHFDYRGLIEKGLALEAPEGMYK